MGDDSTPRRVLTVNNGKSNMYEISSNNYANSYTVNEDHILSLKSKKNKIVNISVKEYIKMDQKFKNKYKGYKVAVEFESIPIKIDPYIFGTLLVNENVSNKYIPKQYKRNTKKIRFQVLAGILDKIGLYQYNKISFSIKEKIFANDLLFIMQSLGILCYINQAKDMYIINIICDDVINDIPFRVLLHEKIESVNPYYLLSDINVKYVGYDNYYGFEIDNNHLFVLGDFTVTHNTSELLTRLSRDAAIGKNVLYINHSFDTRSEELFSTHNGLFNNKIMLKNVTVCKYNILPPLTNIMMYDTIGIDEANFFTDLLIVKEYVDMGHKRVIVCGLVGDSKRDKFGHLIDLIPIADSYDHLTAYCSVCGKNSIKAIFTHRIITNNTDQICVGGEDKYIPVCRKHYLKLNNI
jgi:thymidine kinase